MKATAKTEIIEATRELLQKKTIIDIDVKEIATNAGVSRKSFYVYFRDKYNVMSEIYEQDIDNLFRENRDLSFSKQMELVYGNYIANSRLYRNMFSYDGQNSVMEHMMQHGMSLHVSHVLCSKKDSALASDELFDIEYHVKSLAYITKAFIDDISANSSIKKSISPEKWMATHITNTLPPILKEIYC